MLLVSVLQVGALALAVRTLLQRHLKPNPMLRQHLRRRQTTERHDD